MAKRRLFICYFLSRGDCAASNQRSFITGTHSLPQSLRRKTETAKPENRRSRQARLAAAAHAETRSYDGFGADNCCKETGVYARGGGCTPRGLQESWWDVECQNFKRRCVLRTDCRYGGLAEFSINDMAGRALCSDCSKLDKMLCVGRRSGGACCGAARHTEGRCGRRTGKGISPVRWPEQHPVRSAPVHGGEALRSLRALRCNGVFPLAV